MYLLVGTTDDGRRWLYIGEADALGARISNHLADESKTDWNRLVAFTTTDGSLNKAWVRFLEARLIKLAHEAGRAFVANSTVPEPSRLQVWEVDDLESFLENLLMMLPLIGIHEFEQASKSPSALVYNFKARGSNASGQFLPEGFLVMSGSTGPAAEAPSFVGTSEERLRKRLIAQGVLMLDGDRLRLMKDYVFSSPSAAAGAVGGSYFNGWIQWKDSKGRTLSENEREAVTN